MPAPTPRPDVTAWMVVFRVAYPTANRTQAIRAYLAAHGREGADINDLWGAYGAAA